MSRGERKAMIARDRPGLCLSRQCRLLSISRSSFYYAAKGESAAKPDRRHVAPPPVCFVVVIGTGLGPGLDGGLVLLALRRRVVRHQRFSFHITRNLARRTLFPFGGPRFHLFAY